MKSLNELDLNITDMDSESGEVAVKSALNNLPGVRSALLIERGAFVRYDASVITADQICATVRNSGYRASIFQDSKSGRTGRSSQ